MRPVASAPRLVGRETELGRLDLALESLGPARAAALRIHGEPGIGKTTLLDALSSRAEERGHAALRGRASALESDVPFQVFVDALDDYLGSINPRLLKPLGDERLAELAAAFPALRELADAEPPALPSEERYRAHRATRALLELLARHKDMVLALDDLHWADEASLELLHHLLRNPPRAPILVTVAHRTAALTERWRDVLETAAREGQLEQLEVGPLPEHEATELIAGRIDDAELRQRVYRESGGNPFYLEQLTAHPESLADTNGETRSGDAPRAVVAALAEELRTLGAETRLALEGSAVAGDPFDCDLAARAAQLAEPALLERVDELIARDLVRPTEAPRRFRFRHPIVWRAVYDGTRAGWRLGAHKRVAEELAGRGAPASTRAFHVERAAQPGNLEAVRLLEQAGAEARSRAPAAAAHWYGRAIELLPQAGNEGRRLGLLVAMATALGAAGRIAESRDALRDVLAAMSPEPSEARLQAVVGCASMEFLLRRYAEGNRLLQGAIDALPDPDRREAVPLRLALVRASLWGDEERFHSIALDAVDSTRRHGDAIDHATAVLWLAYAEVMNGRTSAALARYDEADGLLRAISAPALAERPDPLVLLAGLGLHVEREREGVGMSERALALARAADRGFLLPIGLVSTGWELMMVGRLTEAERVFDDLLELSTLTGNVEFEAWALAGRSQALAHAGEPEAGAALGDRARVVAASQADHVLASTGKCRSLAYLEAGDPRRAREAALDDCGGPDLPRLEVPWRPQVWWTLARSELALGDSDAADRWTERLERAAADLALEGRRGWALSARAGVQLSRGEADKASETALASAAALEAAGWPVYTGHSRILAGRALAARGAHQDAKVQLRRAHADLDACGALRYRDQAAAELRRLGERVARAGRRGADDRSLSERQREIAVLVAAGKTNREIAAALYLSEKTVEKHLAAVFEKLGISRRAEIGGRLASREFAESGG